MQVWNVVRAARWKCRTQTIAKNSPSGHHRTMLSGYIFATIGHVSTIGKTFSNSNVSPTYPQNMVDFGPLAAEICWRVWGTPANFSTFRVLAALLHGTRVVGVSQSLRRWTEGATYIRQGGIALGIGPHSSWFCCNGVVISTGKSEFVLFGTRQGPRTFPFFTKPAI